MTVNLNQNANLHRNRPRLWIICAGLGWALGLG